jgi:hypothetical protein
LGNDLVAGWNDAVTEKSGTLYQITEGTKTEIKTSLRYITGLLDIALHPDYAKKMVGYNLFLNWGEGEGGNTKLIQ